MYSSPQQPTPPRWCPVGQRGTWRLGRTLVCLAGGTAPGPVLWLPFWASAHRTARTRFSLSWPARWRGPDRWCWRKPCTTPPSLQPWSPGTVNARSRRTAATSRELDCGKLGWGTVPLCGWLDGDGWRAPGSPPHWRQLAPSHERKFTFFKNVFTSLMPHNKSAPRLTPWTRCPKSLCAKKSTTHHHLQEKKTASVVVHHQLSTDPAQDWLSAHYTWPGRGQGVSDAPWHVERLS